MERFFPQKRKNQQHSKIQNLDHTDQNAKTTIL